MYTRDSFCNVIWDTSYAKVFQIISQKVEYHQFSIPKKGGLRTIRYLDKNSNLWNLQYQLLSKFLVKQALPTCVKGFVKGESYHSFLAEHVGAKFFLRVDISAFFPSITKEHIKRELSNILFCDDADEKEKLLDLIGTITTLNGVLPQGACTSPAMSNLVMARIDQRIMKYCQVFHIRYTRYADDMLFSSDTFDFEDKKWFLRKIKYIVGSQNLKLNYSKIKYAKGNLVLNGYVISKDGIGLSRKRLSDLRHIVAFAKNHNKPNLPQTKMFLESVNCLPLKHRDLRKYPFKTVFQFSQYLCGYRAFLISFVDEHHMTASFQKELRRLIRKVETQIIRYS